MVLFYLWYGFVVVGELFVEVGVLYVEMVCVL